MLSPNDHVGHISPPDLNCQQSIGNAVDTEMTDALDNGRQFGSSPGQKDYQNLITQPVQYGASTSNPVATSYNQVPPPPINPNAKGVVPMSLGKFRSPSRLPSDTIAQAADSISNSNLVDILTSTILSRVTLLMSNNASPEELRNAIHGELSTRLSSTNHGVFNAKSPNENGSVSGQTKPVMCSTCKLDFKRPCDLK